MMGKFDRLSSVIVGLATLILDRASASQADDTWARMRHATECQPS